MKYLKYFEDIEDSLANELNGIYSALKSLAFVMNLTKRNSNLVLRCIV